MAVLPEQRVGSVRAMRGRPPNTAKWRAVEARWRDGERNQTRIAEAVGLHPSTVGDVLVRLGLFTRTRDNAGRYDRSLARRCPPETAPALPEAFDAAVALYRREKATRAA